MDIVKATRSYEQWLGTKTNIVKSDLRFKHELMRRSAFIFLRGTFYRWIARWELLCGNLRKAPRVLAVGDLHAENFGTWRDAEGRLAWGINDFDEAYRLPYMNDLVRLTTSVYLAAHENHLAIDPKRAAKLIWGGYREGMETQGKPFVIGGENSWLVPLVRDAGRDPVKFWDGLRELPAIREAVPSYAVEAIERTMPQPQLIERICRRRAGVGSLGRPRYVAIAQWCGAPLAREAKAAVPSACWWAAGPPGEKATEVRIGQIIAGAVRSPDPFDRVEGGWKVRRLAPDCNKIDISATDRVDTMRLLYAMGRETANIHLGSGLAVKAVRRDLRKHPAKRLRLAAMAMAEDVNGDWEQFCEKPVS